MQGTELLANWVGAVGSAGAAILAVIIYWADKRSTRKSSREAREASRRGQAIHIAALLEPIERQLAELEVASRTNTSAPPGVLMVAAPDKLMDVLRDPTVFSVEELSFIASVVSAATSINRDIATRVVANGASQYVLTKELPTDDIEAARRDCVECGERMLAIARSVGLPAID